MSSTLINGKHYKQVVIDYYDDLIASLDVYAEERMDKIKDNDGFDKDENQKLIAKDRRRILFIDNDFIEQKNQQLRNQYSTGYKLDDEPPVNSNNSGISFKDFVHSERMRGVNEMKKLQKDRLEEIKMAEKKPTTIEEALFGGKKFGFLLEINGRYFVEMGLKFRLLAVVVDFYLDTSHIKQIKEHIKLYLSKYDFQFRYLSDTTVFDEKYAHVYLLARYLCKQIERDPNGECVKRVSLKQLAEIERIDLTINLKQPLQLVAFDNSIDFTRLKSLSLRFQNDHRKSIESLHLNGFPNLESLELTNLKLDLKRNDPFVNIDTSKLHQLKLIDCVFKNEDTNFYDKFSNLEVLYFLNSYSFITLNWISCLKQLKRLYITYNYLQLLDFIKEMTNLVALSIRNYQNLAIDEYTFRRLQNLEHLRIRAKKGKWMRHLTKLRSLALDDLGSDDEDVNYFDYLTNLEELEIKTYDTNGDCRDSFNELKQLKCLRLSFNENFANILTGLEQLTELQIIFCGDTIALKSDEFKHLRNLTKLSLKGRVEIVNADFLDNFPNLTHLELNKIEKFEIKILELGKLEKLKIVFCDLFPTLPNNVFTKLTKLHHLQIFAISLSTLSNANVFNGLENVVEFVLSTESDRNETVDFDLNCLCKMSKLESLYLSEHLRYSFEESFSKLKTY